MTRVFLSCISQLSIINCHEILQALFSVHQVATNFVKFQLVFQKLKQIDM